MSRALKKIWRYGLLALFVVALVAWWTKPSTYAHLVAAREHGFPGDSLAPDGQSNAMARYEPFVTRLVEAAPSDRDGILREAPPGYLSLVYARMVALGSPRDFQYHDYWIFSVTKPSPDLPAARGWSLGVFGGVWFLDG